MSDLTCDVAVIGAGTAGMTAENAARKAGARTLLIDPAFAGTVCASVGCMPSKLLIAAARAAHDAARAEIFGIATDPVIDGAAVMRRVRAERDRFVAGVQNSLDRLPPDVAIRARAWFEGPTALRLDDGRRVTTRATVIATGSAPAIPDPYRDLGDLCLTNRNIFELETLPDSLAVIGAGNVGLELAQAMARLGVQVTVFDRGDTLGISRSDEVNEAIRTALERDLTLRMGTSPEPRREGERVRLDWGDGQSQHFDRVLLAVGRPPQIDGLDLEKTGASLDDKGMPDFSRDTLQIADLPIYIAGDSNGFRPILHEASTEGAVAGRNAAHHPDPRSLDRTPHFTITFTDPPVASLGEGPGPQSLSGTADYSDQGRAKVDAVAHGLVQIHADRHGRLIGADLCAPQGDHLAHHLVWAVMDRVTAADFLRRPFYHPTLEEGLKSALRQICKASETEIPADRDLKDPPGS
ncbi:dihydrolipoyl dehydrogenase [Paracoccus stylophorae]|uniref:Dihydrolipoyl dehydrogenase n=1 Tax=Paracoccus stylophorae TaxID=659350 RepID=A0ABY7SZE8_9RHOB|nr:dihydrolipoyl dehydrogenase [Paracoccus stylophorae]WCR11813.1 dihydrolipoyl dehydrogenase [Paracoccus stylophorae]